MTLPASLSSRLKLPLIAAPMLRVSGPDLVSAACRSGVIGSFPTVNARSPEELDAWLTRIARDCSELDGPTAPVCPNIIMRRDPAVLKADLQVLLKHRVELVIASVGSPEAIVAPLHDIGCKVLTDVASMRHAEKALQVGADGLVLLTAGAGGQTGWVNGLSFVRAVRAIFDGPLVLSGGLSDGVALWAARVLGCDLGLMGTRFIATCESMAVEGYKRMLVESRLDDVMLTQAFTGLDTNMLRPSIAQAGLDPEALAGKISPERARELFSAHNAGRAGDAADNRAAPASDGPKRWVDIWSAGHTVSAVEAVQSVDELVGQLTEEYQRAQRDTSALLRAQGLVAG